MKLSKAKAKALEILYRKRVEWLNEIIKKRHLKYQSGDYCYPISDQKYVDCYMCPAYDNSTRKYCLTNDLMSTRKELVKMRYTTSLAPETQKTIRKSAKQHLKTSQKLYKQWSKKYKGILK